MARIIEDELLKPTIFKDESKLFSDYVPLTLPHREEQLKELANIFRVIIESPGNVCQKALLVGGVGVGKTAVSKRFGRMMEDFAKRRGLNLKYVHVNCHRERTLFLIARRISQEVLPSYPGRGLSAQELLHMVRGGLEDRGWYLLLTLDEVDFLAKSSSEASIYDMIRLGDEFLNAPRRISFIFIAREEGFLYTLNLGTVSTMMHNVIKFKPYTARQLKDILIQRVNEAFHENSVPEESLELIADIAGADTGGLGDARYALEILWRAAKCADKDGLSIVLPDHVRKAQIDINPNLRDEVLRSLHLHEKLLLISLAKVLQRKLSAYVTMGDVEAEYKSICEEFSEEPRKHTQLWGYVQNLKNMDMIITKPSGEGYRGKTTLIGFHNAPASMLERELTRLMEAEEDGGG